MEQTAWILVVHGRITEFSIYITSIIYIINFNRYDTISAFIAFKQSFKYIFSVKNLQCYSYKDDNTQYIWHTFTPMTKSC